MIKNEWFGNNLVAAGHRLWHIEFVSPRLETRDSESFSFNI